MHVPHHHGQFSEGKPLAVTAELSDGCLLMPQADHHPACKQ